MDWMFKGQTVNQVYYKEDSTALQEQARRKRHKMWKNGLSILHLENALAHNTLSKHGNLCVGTTIVLTYVSFMLYFDSKDQVYIKRNSVLSLWMQ